MAISNSVSSMASSGGAGLSSPKSPRVLESAAPLPESDVEVSISDDGESTTTPSSVPSSTTTEVTPPGQNEANPVQNPTLDVEKAFKLPEDKTTKPVVEKPAAEQTIQERIEASKARRDYTGVDAELVEVLSKLPNAAYDKWKTRLPELAAAAKERDTLRNELAEAKKNAPPQYWHESPEAFLLDPQFRQANQTAQVDEFEANHWQRQIQLIEQGQEWFNLVKYNPDGTPVLQKMPAMEDGKIDVQSKYAVLNAMQQAQLNARESKQQIHNIRAQYVNGNQQAVGAIRKLADDLFPAVKPDSLTPEEKAVWTQGIQLVPKVWQNHPLACELLPRANVMFRRLISMYEAVAKERDALRTNGANSRLAGAIPGPGGGISHGDDVIVKESDFD